MNKFIKEQLLKCKTKLPYWDESTNELVITHSNHNNNDPANGNFHIKIAPYILHEPPDFTLSTKWNGGTKPPEEFMSVRIVKQHGEMYFIRGIGLETGINWEGWLPGKGFTEMTK